MCTLCFQNDLSTCETLECHHHGKPSRTSYSYMVSHQYANLHGLSSNCGRETFCHKSYTLKAFHQCGSWCVDQDEPSLNSACCTWYICVPSLLSGFTHGMTTLFWWRTTFHIGHRKIFSLYHGWAYGSLTLPFSQMTFHTFHIYNSSLSHHGAGSVFSADLPKQMICYTIYKCKVFHWNVLPYDPSNGSICKMPSDKQNTQTSFECITKWFFKVPRWKKAFPHSLHLWDLSPWVMMCFLRFVPLLKDLSHKVQWKFFAPVCLNTWFLRSIVRGNVFSHILQACGFIPLCVTMCRFRVVEWAKNFMQMEHWYFFPLCVSFCGFSRLKPKQKLYYTQYKHDFLFQNVFQGVSESNLSL